MNMYFYYHFLTTTFFSHYSVVILQFKVQMFSKSQHLPIVEFKNQKKPSVKDFWQTGYIKKVIGYSNMPLNNKNMHETLKNLRVYTVHLKTLLL
jgi:hypothetical protein